MHFLTFLLLYNLIYKITAYLSIITLVANSISTVFCFIAIFAEFLWDHPLKLITMLLQPS